MTSDLFVPNFLYRTVDSFINNQEKGSMKSDLFVTNFFYRTVDSFINNQEKGSMKSDRFVPTFLYRTVDRLFGSPVLPPFGSSRQGSTQQTHHGNDSYLTELRDRGLLSASDCASPKEKQETVDMRRFVRTDESVVKVTDLLYGATRGTDIYAARGTDIYAAKGTDRYTDRGTDRYTDRGTDRYTYRGTDRYTARGTDIYAAKGTDRYTVLQRAVLERQKQLSELLAIFKHLQEHRCLQDYHDSSPESEGEQTVPLVGTCSTFHLDSPMCRQYTLLEHVPPSI
uniref:Uncharacterized protein n=1 Tax=Timema tahoe TaxID=61484 RepID=A0A7R9P0W9_9NEOP|nr:unnamed protein product [Timema tahoe]